MLWWPRLWRASCRVTLAKGTLPMARSKNPSGRAVSAKLSLRMSALGYKAEAMAALVGSSSTPTMSTANPSGTVPTNVPDPTPGSSVRPPAKPSRAAAAHMAAAMAAGV